MTDELQLKPLAVPTVDQCRAVYGSMLEPTTRSFHAKLLETGYDISLSSAQRFIAKHIKKPQPQPGAVGNRLAPEEVSLIQQVLAELRPMDAPALKARFEKEVLIYNIMLLRFSQRNADRLAMAPKEFGSHGQVDDRGHQQGHDDPGHYARRSPDRRDAERTE